MTTEPNPLANREASPTPARTRLRLVTMIRRYAVTLYRRSVPLIVCAFAGGWMSFGLQHGHEEIGAIGAALAWCWALDLNAQRARVDALLDALVTLKR